MDNERRTAEQALEQSSEISQFIAKGFVDPAASKPEKAQTIGTGQDRVSRQRDREKGEMFGDNWFSALATTRIPDYEFDFCLEALADGPLDFACLAVSTR